MMSNKPKQSDKNKSAAALKAEVKQARKKEDSSELSSIDDNSLSKGDLGEMSKDGAKKRVSKLEHKMTQKDSKIKA